MSEGPTLNKMINFQSESFWKWKCGPVMVIRSPGPSPFNFSRSLAHCLRRCSKRSRAELLEPGSFRSGIAQDFAWSVLCFNLLNLTVSKHAQSHEKRTSIHGRKPIHTCRWLKQTGSTSYANFLVPLLKCLQRCSLLPRTTALSTEAAFPATFHCLNSPNISEERQSGKGKAAKIAWMPWTWNFRTKAITHIQKTKAFEWNITTKSLKNGLAIIF